MICPKCKSRSIGKIGHHQYYCWNCSIEFSSDENGVRVYRLEIDGTAVLECLENTSEHRFASDLNETLSGIRLQDVLQIDGETPRLPVQEM